jgi:hypothetical protein
MSYMPHQTSKGFTLVEVLVIAPIVILAIGTFIGLMVSLVGNVIVTRNSTSQTFDITSALDQMEQDVRLSTEFPVTTGTLPSPQGRNNNFTGTSAFTSSDSLVLTTAATDRPPSDANRRILYYANQPNPCTDTNLTNSPNVVYNRIFTVTNIYFIKDSALWKRTYVPTYNTSISSPDQNTLCTSSVYSPWPRNTCSPGYTASRCQTQDTKLVDNITSSSVKYFATSGSTTDGGPGSAQTATTIEVSLTGQTKATGETVSTTMSRRMSKLNKFSPSASSSQWTSLPAGGGSGQLQGGWAPYGSPFATPGYVKTSGGVVMMKGLLRGGTTTSGTVVANLPAGYRPSSVVTIPVTARTLSGTNGPAVVQILTNGDVTIWYVPNHADPWVSLDGISFLLDDAYPMTQLSLQNGWTPFLSRYLRYGVDGMGRVNIRGQIAPGTTTTNTVISQLPAAQQPDKYYHLMAGAPNNTYIYHGLDASGNITSRGVSTSWMGIENMFYPSSFNGWTYWPPGNGTNQLQNNWTNYGSTYTSASYTKAADGVVSLRGLIGGGSITQSSVIAHLPAGYRPAERQIFDSVHIGGFARLDVWPTGEVVVNAASSNTWLSLNDIKFVAEQ